MHVHEIGYYEKPNAQTSLCIRAVSPGPLLLSDLRQRQHIYVNKIHVKLLRICDKYQNVVCRPISGAEPFGVVCLGT